jgi:acetyltransferase-like isoleucine patch superfamily enzyme
MARDMIHYPVSIRDFAWVATGAIILQWGVIGKGAVVGGGAVVTGDVPEYAGAVGNSARIFGPAAIGKPRLQTDRFSGIF